MLQELLNRLPDSAAGMSPAILCVIAIVGGILALIGPRVSRFVLTLAMVAAGGVAGLNAPHWFGWSIDRMGPALGGALFFGLAAFVMTVLFEAILLGLLLAAIGATAVWMSMAADANFPKTTIDWSATAFEIVLKIYNSLPAGVNRALPAAAIIGLFLGLCTTALWPRLGRSLMYIVGGISMFIFCGALGLKNAHSPLFAQITSSSWTQAITLGWMMLLAGIVQWLTRQRRSKHISYVQCPECNEMSQLGSAKCKRCGARFAAIPHNLSRPLRQPH